MTKLYFDCVTPEGEAAIVYCAQIRWRGVSLAMGSRLESGEGLTPRTRTVLGRYKASDATGEWALEHPRLGVEGRWRGRAPSFEQTLYESPEGSVHWHCMQPAAQAEVRVGDRILRGEGYAERLTLSVAPWRLPLQQLRWGRFVAERCSLVWIDWSGEHHMSLALVDGQPREFGSATEARVQAAGAELRLDPGTILREGKLGDTILHSMPSVMRLFPSSVFHVQETKWLSRAFLRTGGAEVPGWAIHELVRWTR